jgi:hypothetical protein
VSTRARLLAWSAPVALLLVLVIVKTASMVVASRSAATAFATGDTETLRTDVAVLRVFDVVDPAGTALAAGGLAVLDGRLDEAERQFAAAGADCPAVTGLVLVRETRGDDAVGASDGPLAIDRYRSALDAAGDAPDVCFGANADPDGERREVLADTVPRLQRKLAVLERPLAPPPLPPPPAAGAPPPPASPESGPAEDREPDTRRLDPDAGDPLDKLRQILQDSASVRGGP